MKPKPRSRFSRENCVSLLHSAFKGLGTNEKLVIDVLGGLGREQRVEVARGYKARYRTVSRKKGGREEKFVIVMDQ